jgi:AraC-like DNA-binding protein
MVTKIISPPGERIEPPGAYEGNVHGLSQTTSQLPPGRAERAERVDPRQFTLDQWRVLARRSGYHLHRLAALPEVSRGVRSVERLFRQNFSAPPSHYLKHWRVEEACAYISTTGASNKEAAYRFGFWDEAHLCHLFRQVLNRTPQSFAPRRHSRPPAEASGIYKELSGFCNPVDLGGTSDVIKGKL